MSVTEHTKVNTGSGNGLKLSTSQTLRINVDQDLCCHMASTGHTELNEYFFYIVWHKDIHLSGQLQSSLLMITGRNKSHTLKGGKVATVNFYKLCTLWFWMEETCKHVPVKPTSDNYVHYVNWSLTHYPLVIPHGDTDFSQHWPRLWLVAWQYWAKT